MPTEMEQTLQWLQREIQKQPKHERWFMVGRLVNLGVPVEKAWRMVEGDSTNERT